MYQLISKIQELDISQLQSVYEESIAISGSQLYPSESENMQLLLAQQDLYSDIMLGIKKYGRKYALWVVGGVYKAVARLERYSDGYLLAGLETVREDRCKGYATMLIHSIIESVPVIGINKLYSHVDRRNLPSVAVHVKCGFYRISDSATFLDGSVSNLYDTYLYEVEPRL